MLVRRLSPNTPVVELGRIAVVAQAVEKHGMPQLICLDLKLPDTNGVSGIRELKRSYPDVPILVLTASPASDYEDLAMEAGAAAFLEKSVGATEIAHVLRAFLVEELDADAETPVAVGKLSKRQKQLLVLLDKGLSNRDIADNLQISEHTVKVHLWRLFRRLNVKSRSQASHLARTQGLL
jgi:DNA-binding NarL/FixJ family response regulator